MINFSTLKDNNNGIAKVISYQDGQVKKSPKASIYDGQVTSVALDSWQEFADYLTNIPRDECVVLGDFLRGDSAKTGMIDDPANGSYRRSKRSATKPNGNFDWHDDYQLCCIDFDGSAKGDLTPDQMISELDKDLTGFADITKVVKYSSGAWLYHNDELVSENNGFHLYFMCNSPEKMYSVFNKKGGRSWLEKKLWLSGHGYIKNSKPKDVRITAVSQMERCLYDRFVFSPERILFEAEPILRGGLHKINQDAFIIERSTNYLDLKQYNPPTKAEEKKYLRLVQEAKNLNEDIPYMIECREMFSSHVRKRVKQGKYKDRAEYKGLRTDEIVKREYKASRRGFLMQDHEIELTSGEIVTPEDIMNDPKRYHGQSCKDPHEPDYGNSDIAIIYTNKKEPIIFSHAHGGITYRLDMPDKLKSEPDFHSREYWLEHFYMVAYEKKDEIYHINENKIEKYSHSGFNHKFSGFFTDVGDEEKPKLIPMAKWWMGNIDKKCIAGDGFAPDQPIIYEKHGELVINEYVPEILHYGFDIPDLEEYQQRALPWLTHIRKMIHKKEEAEILIDWFAYLVQHPNERPMFAPLVLSETRGVGKDMMTDIFSSLIGHKFSKKSTVETLSKGDGWGDIFYHTKLITVSECGSSTDRYTISNNIKDKITATTQPMNLKGKAMLFGCVFAGIIFFSNSTSPFRLDDGDRRFFISRCDWSKKEADEYKKHGHFSKLASFYSDTVHLHGLYHYLLNREINTDMKGDAPMTSTKEILMHSEPNETEQFFIDLRNHPCKYWTSSMVSQLYKKVCGGSLEDDFANNKQFKHFLKEMVSLKKMKVKGKTVRLKTFSMVDAERDNKSIRLNVDANWDITTSSLHPSSVSSSTRNNVLDICCNKEPGNEESGRKSNVVNFLVGADDNSDEDLDVALNDEYLKSVQEQPEKVKRHRYAGVKF